MDRKNEKDIVQNVIIILIVSARVAIMDGTVIIKDIREETIIHPVVVSKDVNTVVDKRNLVGTNEDII